VGPAASRAPGHDQGRTRQPSAGAVLSGSGLIRFWAYPVLAWPGGGGAGRYRDSEASRRQPPGHDQGRRRSAAARPGRRSRPPPPGREGRAPPGLAALKVSPVQGRAAVPARARSRHRGELRGPSRRPPAGPEQPSEQARSPARAGHRQPAHGGLDGHDCPPRRRPAFPARSRSRAAAAVEQRARTAAPPAAPRDGQAGQQFRNRFSGRPVRAKPSSSKRRSPTSSSPARARPTPLPGTGAAHARPCNGKSQKHVTLSTMASQEPLLGSSVHDRRGNAAADLIDVPGIPAGPTGTRRPPNRPPDERARLNRGCLAGPRARPGPSTSQPPTWPDCARRALDLREVFAASDVTAAGGAASNRLLAGARATRPG